MQNSDINQLKEVKKIIEKHFKFESHLIEPSEINSLSTLICILPKGPVRLERNLNLTFLPLNDKDIKEIKLLQFFSILPGQTFKNADDKLKDVLLYISQRTALGNFSIHNSNEIAIRYVYPFSKNNEIDSSNFAETLSLFLLTLDLFSIKLRNFANGLVSAADILKNV